MKKIILTIALVTVGMLQAQIAIGKDDVDGSGILDFATGDARGIMLPRVTEAAGITTPGTLYYDADLMKVICKGHTEEDLSVKEGEFAMTATYTALDEEGDGVILGDGSGAPVPEGVLVLDDPARALILPKVASPHLNIKNPEAGLICYDTDSDMLAVYDGKQWAFWGK